MTDDYTPAGKTYTFEVTTTQQCNLGCSYCFEGCGDNPSENHKLNATLLSKDQVSLLKEKIYYKLDNLEEDSQVKIDFWGGEPTLNLPLIKSFIEEFKGKNVRFHIYTNGYDIRGLEQLALPSVRIQVSYDGAIPDPFRLTLTGKDSTQKVRENILKLLEIPNIDLHLKATLVPEYFRYLEDIWEDYADLYYKFKDKGIKLPYSPTIDYYEDTKHNNYMDVYKEKIISITKKELEFAEKNGENLLSWYGGVKGSQCSAGQSIVAVTVEGEVLACHGAIYQENREELHLADIEDSTENFFTKLKDFSNKISQYEYSTPSYCNICPATTCVKCPVLKSSISTKDTLEERWYDDNNQPQMCSYFQYFGKVDRAFQEILIERGL
jgi:radical SAM protein with 4Fe4S-binding SPASM domain